MYQTIFASTALFFSVSAVVLAIIAAVRSGSTGASVILLESMEEKIGRLKRDFDQIELLWDETLAKLKKSGNRLARERQLSERRNDDEGALAFPDPPDIHEPGDDTSSPAALRAAIQKKITRA